MKRISHCIMLWTLVVTTCLTPWRSAQAFTIGEEREVGEKLLYTVRSTFELLDDPDLKQYIEKLGEEVVDAAGLQFFDYHFFIIKNKDFNAFAAPSGLIFFHSGLIEKVDGENELVSVLAHEVGHIVKRHISSRLDKGQKISIATMGAILAALALGGGAATEALLAGSMAVGQSANLHFSRMDEEEADLLAYQWMKKLKRHPEGQVKMLQTMRQIARYRSAMIPQYLLTHPNPEMRLNYVQTLLSSEEDALAGHSRDNTFEFLRFKYRILTQTKDSLYLRGYFSSVLASSKASELDIAMAKYGMAQLDRNENNYQQSLSLIEEVVALLGEKNILMADRGIIEYESGDSGKAFATLSAAYEADRSNMHAAFALANVCFSLGKMEKALQLYQEVMYRMPEYAKVYFELGRVSAALGKTAETSYYLGKYYLLEGKLELARQQLEKASADSSLSEELGADIKQSLELIKRLER